MLITLLFFIFVFLAVFLAMMRRLMLIFLFVSVVCKAQTIPYQDLTHNSKVFSKLKTFRLYLPKDYEQSGESYPVIYFLHGWGGRHFKDESAKLDYVRLGELVDQYRFIMVMWDGNIDESEPRPYNVGEHHDVKFRIQMKDYFPELIHHIDSTYRTFTDRNNRGIIGFSMGGFMSAYLAGKYPDMVSAITEMVGSPEFFVGYPENHSWYPIRYTFDNLRDVAVRFHNMDNCPLFYMNTEVRNAAEWDRLEHFAYWLGEGDHSVDEPGEIKIFETAVQHICDHFKNPVPRQKSWSHYDLYPDFELWGYSVKSNKNEPGFLYLRNVSPAGFGLYSQKWLPDGPSIKNCTVSVSTAPIYRNGSAYDITIYQQGKEAASFIQTAGKDGRLHFDLTGDGCEVSISRKSQAADFVASGYQLEHGGKYIRPDKKNNLAISLLNRGSELYAGKTVHLSVSCTDTAVSLDNAIQNIQLDRKSRIFQTQPVHILCRKAPPTDASPPWLKLLVEVRCDKDVFTDHITVPVFYDVPVFKHVRIDDGAGVRDGIYGKGNGDGQVNASEQVMLYENYQRLRLYTDDPYVISDYEKLHDHMIPAIWPDGFTFSSIVKIADNCPPDHTIEFLAHYESKTFMPIRRNVHWGKVKITVK